MRCLSRNKTKFYYAQYTGREPVRDENGNLTGEYMVTYGEPKAAYANISAAQGETEARQFGDDLAYDKVIVMADTKTEINEFSVLWVDESPYAARRIQTESGNPVTTENLEALYVEDGNTLTQQQETEKTPHNYIVVRKATSLNSVSFAIRRVDVS